MAEEQYLKLLNILGFAGSSTIGLIGTYATIFKVNNVIHLSIIALISIIITLISIWVYDLLSKKSPRSEVSFNIFLITTSLFSAIWSTFLSLVIIPDSSVAYLLMIPSAFLSLFAFFFYSWLARGLANRAENRPKRVPRERQNTDNERVLARRNVEYMRWLERLKG